MGTDSQNPKTAVWGAVGVCVLLLLGFGVWWATKTPEVHPPARQVAEQPEPKAPSIPPSPKPDKEPPQPSAPSTSSLTNRAPVRPPSRSLAVALRSVKEDAVKRVVDALSDDALEGRLTGSQGIARARELLTSEWTASNVERFGGSYLFPWTSANAGSCANLIAVHRGSDPVLRDEVVLIGAHYDHIGMAKKPSRGDFIFNGADDNASGSVAVLFAAKLFAEHALETKRTVVFALFSGEEQGFYGSEAYCDSPPLALKSHVAMVNLDMVGRNPKRPVRLYGVGTSPTFGPLVREAFEVVRKETQEETISGLRMRPIRPLGPLHQRSDQYEFWSRGIPVMVFHSGVHADYHKLSDHAYKLSTPRLVRVTRAAMSLVYSLANSSKSFPFRKVPR